MKCRIRKLLRFKYRLGRIQRLAAAVVDINPVAGKRTAAKIHDDVRGNFIQQNSRVVASKAVSGKMRIAGADIVGIIMQADAVIFKRAVRGVDPHVSKA